MIWMPSSDWVKKPLPNCVAKFAFLGGPPRSQRASCPARHRRAAVVLPRHQPGRDRARPSPRPIDRRSPRVGRLQRDLRGDEHQGG